MIHYEGGEASVGLPSKNRAFLRTRYAHHVTKIFLRTLHYQQYAVVIKLTRNKTAKLYSLLMTKNKNVLLVKVPSTKFYAF